MKRIWLIIAAIFCYLQSQAQFQIGYKFGYWNPREINRVIYLYNQLNDNGVYHLEKQMPSVHLNKGLSVGLSFAEDDVFMELRWSNRHSIVSSEFKNKNGGNNERVLKIRANTFEFGFGVNDEHHRYGLNLGIGNFKGFGKMNSDTTGKYFKLFQLDKSPLMTTQASFIPWYQIKFAKVFGLRIYYQYMFMSMNLDYLDTWMIGKSIIFKDVLEDKASSIGVELNINIGNYIK